ncbi:hypothetical protein AB1Y20_021161 [Prymnesium parvum]|uniref:PCI domain-containing protein n=1 Tax=Prymnesium parvum TaxID=97485 RepID=A0AB34JKR1_PRYPA|mmetsp:Transcript_17811/g.37875  ORF Transcript_17811/g.37875 Transcript_17811/m.37875 type:complete len:389 (+) Transcript_17811:26-1192(+)
MAHDAKTRAILSFLQGQATTSPALASEFAVFEDLYTRKLWHQLTVKLEEFLSLEGTAELLIPLYETFISDFKYKINKLVLARIQCAVARQLSVPDKVIAFCDKAIEESAKEDKQASIYITCELARMLIDMERLEECKARIETAAAYVDGTAGIENTVQASYCRARAAYFKVSGPASEFYQYGLLLLAYAPLSEMSEAEATTISFDLGIAALVGEGLYNFGELLEHPVVSTLEATESAWLAQLLRAFNAGDIAKYEALVAQHHLKLEEQPALLANTNFLKEKIALMCLTETLFQRQGDTSGDREITFAEISAASKLPLDQVELLVMRALSLKLIRGVMDQVKQTLRVTWVQPRVLQQSQIALMTERLSSWQETVNSTLTFLESETPEFA